MNATKILSPAVAEKMYDSMCSMNNMGTKLTATFSKSNIVVEELPRGAVTISEGPDVREVYEDRMAFAIAYGLFGSAVSEPAGACGVKQGAQAWELLTPAVVDRLDKEADTAYRARQDAPYYWLADAKVNRVRWGRFASRDEDGAFVFSDEDLYYDGADISHIMPFVTPEMPK